MDNTANTTGRPVDPRVLVVLAVAALLLIVALASSINLDSFKNNDSPQAGDPGSGQSGGFDPGEGGRGRDLIEFGEPGSARIFQNEDGSISIEGPNGESIADFVEDPDGNITGIEIDKDGNVSVLKRGESPDPDSTVIRPGFGGTTTIERPDGPDETLDPGEGWEIFLGDGGVEVRAAPRRPGFPDAESDPNGDFDRELGQLDRQTNPNNDNESSSGGLLKALLLIALVIVLGLLAFFGIGYWKDRDKQQPAAEEAPDQPFAQARGVVMSLIDQVRAEPDPRLAIQKAWAAAESGFGQAGMERHAAETPAEFLHRTVGVVDGLQAPLGRLVQLFELARFSHHPITQDMRTDAIHQLETIKSEIDYQSQPVLQDTQ